MSLQEEKHRHHEHHDKSLALERQFKSEGNISIETDVMMIVDALSLQPEGGEELGEEEGEEEGEERRKEHEK